MSKRLFSRDAATGITKWFHYDDATDEMTIHTEQDMTAVVDHNKILQNEQTRLDRWGDGKRVATVPLSVFMEWVKTGMHRDEAAVKRWLNDPENRMYRTFNGQV